MARIDAIRLVPLRIPVAVERVNCAAFSHEPLARGPSGKFDGVWFGDQTIWAVEACSDAGGPSGWGELSHAFNEERAVAEARSHLGADLEEITPQLERGAGVVTRGVHLALLDWRARREERPLHDFFGRKRRDQVRVAWFCGHQDPAGAATHAREAAAQGITSMKLKAGELTDTAGIVASIHAVEPRMDIVIDPNGRWLNFDFSLERLRGIGLGGVSPAGVYLEDPTHADREQWTVLRSTTGVKLIKTTIGGEATRAAIERWQIDALNLVGTWPQLIAASAEAAAHRVPCWAGSAVTTGIGDLATLQFALTQDAFTFGAEIAASQVRQHDLLASPILVSAGHAKVPEGPGLGVEIDLDALERYRAGDVVVVR